MTFVGVNYIAVLVAASVAWIFGGIWYRLLAKPWMAAHGFTSEQVRAHHGNYAAMWPLIVSRPEESASMPAALSATTFCASSVW